MWIALVTAGIAAVAGLVGVLIGQRGERNRWHRDAKFLAHTYLIAMVHRYTSNGVMDMLLQYDKGVNITALTSALIARCRQDLGLKYIFKRQPRFPS